MRLHAFGAPAEAGRKAGAPDAGAGPPAPCAAPEGPAVRYERPRADLADFVHRYHLHAVRGPDAAVWRLPGAAVVSLLVEGEPAAVRIGRRAGGRMPDMALIGPTSAAICMTGGEAVRFGFELSALGWARLLRRPAGDAQNAVLPLERLAGPDLPRSMLGALAGASDGRAMAAALDALLAPALAIPHPEEATVRAIAAALDDPDLADVAALAERVGVADRQLRTVVTRWFGMPPKRLLRRERFLRAFLAVRGEGAGYLRIGAGYHDTSHFLRDADEFLGMTPRRFMRLPTPFLDAEVPRGSVRPFRNGPA